MAFPSSSPGDCTSPAPAASRPLANPIGRLGTELGLSHGSCPHAARGPLHLAVPTARVPAAHGVDSSVGWGPKWLGYPHGSSPRGLGDPTVWVSPWFGCPHCIDVPVARVPHSPAPHTSWGPPSLVAPGLGAPHGTSAPCSAARGLPAPAPLLLFALWPPAEGRLKGTSLAATPVPATQQQPKCF